MMRESERVNKSLVSFVFPQIVILNFANYLFLFYPLSFSSYSPYSSLKTTSSSTMTFSLIAYATKDNVVNVDTFTSLELTAILD